MNTTHYRVHFSTGVYAAVFADNVFDAVCFAWGARCLLGRTPNVVCVERQA